MVLKLHFPEVLSLIIRAVNGLLGWVVVFLKKLVPRRCVLLPASLYCLKRELFKATLALADTAGGSDGAYREKNCWLKLFYLQRLCFPQETLCTAFKS